MATDRSAGGPGVVLVAATGLAAAAVALDAGFRLPTALRVMLFAVWAAAVGLLAWYSLGRPVGRRQEAWLAGVLAVVAFGLVVACVPGGARASRLAPPWSAATPTVRLTVTTGDPVVARGAGVTVACFYEWQPADAPPPVSLEVRDVEGAVRSLDPIEELPGVLSARLPAVTVPIDYRFVGGETATAWHHITPADPVHLTAETTLTARPPSYATGQFPDRTFTLSEPAVCLAGGCVSAHLTFDRPAAEVRAVWQPDGADTGRFLPVEPTADGRSAVVTTEVWETGRLIVTWVGEHRLASSHEFAVTAVADQPPQFVNVSGLESGRWAVRPGVVLSLAVELIDDAWATPPVLELLVGASPQSASAIPVTLAGQGGRYLGRASVDLGGRWVSGRLLVRLRARDHLRSDGVQCPADGWVELVASESAPLLAEQIVLAQRDRVAVSLSAAEREVRDRELLARLLTETAGQIHHVEELDPLADALRRMTTKLADGTADVSRDLAAALDLNRRLTVVRLDRFRLTALAASSRQLAGQNPSAAEIARLRDRLAAVVSTSPRLSAARAAADEQAVADAVAGCERLADELEATAARLQAERAERLRPFVGRIESLVSRAVEGETRWAVTARLVGANPSITAQLRRAERLVADGRATDALPGLGVAERQLSSLAAELSQAAETRGDPREAAKQLVRWRADLDARPGPPPAEELRQWHAVAQTLAAVSRTHHPSGGTTPERIAREFPTPAEFRRGVAAELRERLPRLQVPVLSADEWKAFAERMAVLPPGVDGTRSRLAAAAARRVADDLIAGRAHDAAVAATELRWRVELLIDELAGNADPLAVPPGTFAARSDDRHAALALRIGLPPDLADKADDHQRALRERIDGTTTDRQRVVLFRRWWATRSAINAEHVRDLAALLETVRCDEDKTARLALRQLLRMTSAVAKNEVTVALGRLADTLGPAADVRLADRADLDRPTTARRLIDADAGGWLPGKRAADDAGQLARDIGTLARDLASASARFQAGNRSSALRAEIDARLTPLGATLGRPGVRDEIAEAWLSVSRVRSEQAVTEESLTDVVTALRLMACVTQPVETASRGELRIGRWLQEAEARLTRCAEPNGTGVAMSLREVSRLLDSVADERD